MTRLDELISDELTAIANSSPVPADLAERAIAGGRRRRRRIGATLAGAVSAPFVTSVNAAVSPERRIGRYDTTTGDIRWYDIPVLLGTAPRISPDGRYAAAAANNPSDRPEEAFAKVVVVDLTTGRATVVDLAPADAAAAVYTINGLPAGFHPGDGLTWRPDSRHLMVGNAIVDLTGRHTGTLPPKAPSTVQNN